MSTSDSKGGAPTGEGRTCDCQVNCCLHVYADVMLEMLYRYASECAECDGEGEVVVSSVRRDVDWWDDTMGPCSACEDIRALLKVVDPSGNLLQRRDTVKRAEREEQENDIAF